MLNCDKKGFQMLQPQIGTSSGLLHPSAGRGRLLRLRGRPRDYVLFVGGQETAGRQVAEAYPALLEQWMGLRCVNLGRPDGGLESYWCDAQLIARARAARLVVVQVPGLLGQCNRFYTVHPRRNDRFLRANTPLRQLYPEADFSRIAFVGHLLSMLEQIDAARSEQIYQELQLRWMARVRLTLKVFARPAVLLWLDLGLDRSSGHVTPQLLQAAGNGAAILQVSAGLTEDRHGQIPTAPLQQSQSLHHQIADSLLKVLPRLPD